MKHPAVASWLRVARSSTATASGSLPAAALTLLLLHQLHVHTAAVSRVITPVLGVAILLTVLANPDGVVAEWVKTFRYLKRVKKWGRPYFIDLADVADPMSDDDRDARVPARTLTVERLTVRYGAVVAVNFAVLLLGVTTALAELGVPYQPARLLAGACEGVFLYCAMRWWVFSPSRSTASAAEPEEPRRPTGRAAR